ncbi:MAG: M20/M25/M40 family metallo-hydrolase, partial [Psychromonas sp.]|nr:M20/M25/M40 family metallo-hydrolase [Psychromonas sp.]
ALQADALNGKILINTDSEQEGELYVGCAGGINVNINFPYEKMEAEPTDCAYTISVSGLKGGHSGCDINRKRGNAIKVLAGVLHNMSAIPFHLACFEGGSLRNAIPREASALIVCNKQYQNSLEMLLNNLQLTLKQKFKNSDANLQLSINSSELPLSVLTSQSQTDFLNCLHDCDNGVFSMDEDFPDVVQTSSNIGVVSQNKEQPTSFNIQVLVRSQSEQEKQISADKIAQHFQLYGAICSKEGNYPGWKPNPHSIIYKIMAEQYTKLFNKEAETMVIHAGLECGLFSNKYPHWDMISFGPTIKFPHSPAEKVDIESVDKYWQLLIATLKAID